MGMEGGTDRRHLPSSRVPAPGVHFRHFPRVGTTGALKGHAEHNGLTDFGNTCRELNRLRMLVDISHVSDGAFWDALERARRRWWRRRRLRAISGHPRSADDMIAPPGKRAAS
jgi:hypothetical protein